jgi:hypothetical protein
MSHNLPLSQTVSDKTLIHVAKGDPTSSTAKGVYTCVIPDTNGKVASIQLPDMLHVPELNHNLLSVPQLCNNGWGVWFHKFQPFLVSPTGKEFPLHFDAADNLFKLHPQSNMVRSYATTVSKLTEIDFNVFHNRHGHLNETDLRKVATKLGIKLINYDKDFSCTGCIAGKMHKSHIGKKHVPRSKIPFEVVHVDLSGKIPKSKGGYQYYVTFTEDSARYSYVYFLKQRSDVGEALKLFLVEADKLSKGKYSITDTHMEIHCDDAGELIANKISRTYSTPHRHELNGIAERFMRTIADMARSSMFVCGAPVQFWRHFIAYAVYIRNGCPTSANDGMSPYRKLYGHERPVHHLKILGCSVKTLDFRKSTLPKLLELMEYLLVMLLIIVLVLMKFISHLRIVLLNVVMLNLMKKSFLGLLILLVLKLKLVEMHIHQYMMLY